MHLTELRDRRVVVWGTGREAAAAVKAIAPHEPAELLAVQDKETFLANTPAWTPEVAALAPLRLGDAGYQAVVNADVVVRSPIVGERNPWIIEARRRGVRITGGTALWMADHASRSIGVTGSKGKTTTTLLIHHILTELGVPNVLGGNVGVAALDLPEADLYVLELSMYQCADLDDSPRVAALTSLYPEHLDWVLNDDEREYFRHKLNLVAHRPGRVVYNGEDLRLPTELARFGGELPVLAVNGPGTFHVAAGPDGMPWFCRDSEPMFPRSALPLVGRHNAGNLCVALGVFESIGIDCMGRRDAIVAALTTFVRPPHRLAPIEDPSGITFVNDSISTIPESTIHAIEAYADRPLTVILGGQDRNLDYSTLRAFLEDRAVAATLIGIPDSGPRILGALDGLPLLSLLEAPDLVSAVRLARACTPSGGAVLLSPAAPAYGHFDNFEHRAKVFLQAIADTRSDTQAVPEPL